jgi:hypothetical protein
MIVNPDNLVQARLAVVPHRALLSNETKTVSLQQPDELT